MPQPPRKYARDTTGFSPAFPDYYYDIHYDNRPISSMSTSRTPSLLLLNIRNRSNLLAEEDIDSPFDHIPFEILQEICLACLDDDEYPSLDPTQAPLLLMHISSGIRHVAASTPALWNGIYVDCRDMIHYCQSLDEEASARQLARFSYMYERRAVMIKEWLARSGSLPLKICIDSGESGANALGREPIIHNLVSSILDFSDRWEEVTIFFPEFSFPFIEKLRGSDVPLLRSLYLSMCFTKIQLVDAPNLAILELDRISKSNVLVWPKNLTHIRIMMGTWFGWCLLELLQLSPQVIECSLRCSMNTIFGDDDPDSAHIICLPSLKVLTLGDDVTDLFPFLYTPSLETLELDGSLSRTALTRILDKLPNLTRMRIRVNTLSELESILPHCPSLTALRVSGTFPSSGPVADEISRDQERLDSLLPIISPKLVHFSKVDSTPFRWDDLVLNSDD